MPKPLRARPDMGATQVRGSLGQMPHPVLAPAPDNEETRPSPTAHPRTARQASPSTPSGRPPRSSVPSPAHVRLDARRCAPASPPPRIFTNSLARRHRPARMTMS